ncbi:LysR family transcriptional regulator [Bordetella genomosp. 9]|uniref:LysR family transcriptional regulator n=1 Tax=Bordetella genomosp. 9 TaxID=1416803 RepID=A0A261R643_9BORD|nr:LysR substrate-binding domain-containing protein [Bordetella genomosp. 9]OZI19823.1 LysR family transcriptional regulator [Bordetella genomosp. 9]
MDLRQLRYYVQIVELGSISSAAQALHVAQPSLSQHVANLESELETPLFIRGHNGVQATEAGEVLYRHAKTVLRQLDETKAAVKTQRDTPAGQVTVGLPTSTSRVLAIPLMRVIAMRYPDVRLKLVERSTAELAEAVATQKADLGICVEVRPHAGMHITHVLDEEIMLVARSDHPGRGPISMEEVVELPLVLPGFPNSVRVLYEQALARGGLPLRLVAETSSTSISLAAVAAGIGYALQPWSATRGWGPGLEQGEANGFVLRSLAPVPLFRRMSLCMSHSASMSPTCQIVGQALLALMSEMVGSGAWQGVRPVAPTP